MAATVMTATSIADKEGCWSAGSCSCQCKKCDTGHCYVHEYGCHRRCTR